MDAIVKALLFVLIVAGAAALVRFVIRLSRGEDLKTAAGGALRDIVPMQRK